MTSDGTPDATDLRARLTPLQYAVTQEAQTERPFTGAYLDNHDDGLYRCVVCHAPLFDSGTKFESGSGWPSFYDVLQNGRVEQRRDVSHGMTRIEVVCASCGAHLGISFPTARTLPGCATASIQQRSTSSCASHRAGGLVGR